MKLIVSDIDGTLLKHGGKYLAKRDIDIINDVSKGNIFVAATGRSYPEVKRIFFEADDYTCVCCDGALAVSGEETIFEIPFDSDAISLFSDCTNIIFYGKYMMYAKGTNRFLRMCREQFYSHITVFDSIEEIDTPIYKAVLYKQENADFRCEGLKKIYDSYEMAEYVMDMADKFFAVQSIMKLNNINAEDCIVFGDGDNDKMLLKSFKNSYAMVWSKPSVKSCAGFVSEDVTKTLIYLGTCL